MFSWFLQTHIMSEVQHTHRDQNHMQILTQVLVRRCFRLPHSAAVSNFECTSLPHALFKQLFLKFLLEVRSKMLQTDLKCHVVVLKLYDVARGMAEWWNSNFLHIKVIIKNYLCWVQGSPWNFWDCLLHISKVRLFMYLHEVDRSHMDPSEDSCHPQTANPIFPWHQGKV